MRLECYRHAVQSPALRRGHEARDHVEMSTMHAVERAERHRRTLHFRRQMRAVANYPRCTHSAITLSLRIAGFGVARRSSIVAASMTSNSPLRVRRSEVRCAALPHARPRSRASARTYVPPPQMMETFSSSSVCDAICHSYTVTGDGASTTLAPARAARYAGAPCTFFAENSGGTCGITPVSRGIAASTASRDGRAAVRITSPVGSPVSVSSPNRIVASYTLGSLSMKVARRVARPSSRTSSPVANGSSVPRWPILRSAYTRRAISTTSCDVMPAGLSTSSRPDTPVSSPFTVRVFRLYLRQERLDARCFRRCLVDLEIELGGQPQSQCAADLSAEPMADLIENGDRVGAVTVHDAHVNASAPEVRSDIDAGDRHHAADARITRAARQVGCDLLTDGGGYALSSAIVARHCETSRCRGARRKRARDLFLGVALDNVADLDVVEVLDADTALEALAHFTHIILEAAQRADDAVVHLDTIANDTHATRAVDDSIAHAATSDDADARDLEYLADLRVAENHLALFGAKHAFQRELHILDGFVDDLVQLDLDALALGGIARVVVRTHVEADDDSARRTSEQNVALRDRTDTAMDDLDCDFRRGQLPQRVGECFRRTALIRLDDYAKCARLTRRGLRHEVFQRNTSFHGATAARLAIESLTTLRDFMRRRCILDGQELI